MPAAARTIALVALSAAWYAVGSVAAAADQSAEPLTIKQVSVGFGGKFKAGFWQPVRLTMVAGPNGARGHLRVVVPDCDQSPAAYDNADRAAIDLTAGQEQSLLLYAKSGPVGAPLTVQLMSDVGPGWSREMKLTGPALRSTQEFVVAIGGPVGLEEAGSSIRRRGDLPMQAATVTAASDLPDAWLGYDGVDVLVVSTRDDKFMSALSDRQREAIVQWVLLGGRIVLCVGARGQELSTKESVWSPLIPGELVEIDVLRDRSGLDAFTKSDLPFDEERFQRNRPAVTRLKNIRGEVLLDESSTSAGRPLIVHAPAGLGQVTFVGLDIDHPSLSEWKGRPRLLAALLHRGSTERERGEREIRKSVTHLGYEDLIGQLRTALDQFPGVSLVSFTTVSVLTLIYLLLIGPGDFLLLSRLKLPRHATWITFPLIATAVIGLSAALGRQSHGHNVRLNSVEIVDIDLANELARGTAWFDIYSPATRAYDLQLKTHLPPGIAEGQTSGWLAWQGLPGDSLGGLESKQPTLLRREPYSIFTPGSQPEIDGLTVQIAASKSLIGRWWATTNLKAETSLSVDRYGSLAGEFTSPLPMQLSECLLAHDEKLYRLGTLAPGQRVVMAELAPLDLESRLTQRRVEQTKDISTPWDQASTDIPRIMQMLMFHEAARGRAYTGLTHRYQPQIDLSEHVRLGQAILIGRTSTPVANIFDKTTAEPLINDKTAATTYYTWYRLILPVRADH